MHVNFKEEMCIVCAFSEFHNLIISKGTLGEFLFLLQSANLHWVLFQQLFNIYWAPIMHRDRSLSNHVINDPSGSCGWWEGRRTS